MLLRSGFKCDWTGDGRLQRRVQFLPGCLTPAQVFVYEGPKGEERLVRVEHHSGYVRRVEYEGESGHERKVREILADDTTVHYFGKKDHERKVRMVAQECTFYYVGESGRERLYKNRDATGDVSYYEGAKGEERLVRMETIGYGALEEDRGGVRHYLGAQGKEYCVRVDRVDGIVEHMVGETRGTERVARRVTVAGTEWHYDGARHEERVVKIVWPDNGEVQLYEGPRGHERKVKTTRPSGAEQFFTGPPGHERKMRVTYKGSAGEQRFCGPRGKEKLFYSKTYCYVRKRWFEEYTLRPGSGIWSSDVRRVLVREPGRNDQQTRYDVHFRNGDVVMFMGEGDQQVKIAVVHPDGRHSEYLGAQGEERKVKTFFTTPEALRERIHTWGNVSIIPNQGRNVVFFKGAAGEEHVVNAELADGRRYSYRGERGHEAIVKCVHPNGIVDSFDGSPKREYKIKRQFPSGLTEWYEGEPGEERLARTTEPMDNAPRDLTTFYYGARGQERIAWKAWPNGKMEYFSGVRNVERKVVEVTPDGMAWHFEGERGHEREVANVRGSGAPVGARFNSVGVKRKLGEALECLEELSATGKCNEHVFNEMGKQLRNVYTACNGDEHSAA